MKRANVRGSPVSVAVVLLVLCARLDSTSTFSLRDGGCSLSSPLCGKRTPNGCDGNTLDYSEIRRRLIVGVAFGPTAFLTVPSATAASWFRRFGVQTRELYVVSPEANSTSTLQQEASDFKLNTKTVEQCLLRLLPVNNRLFREIEASIGDGVNTLQESIAGDSEPWQKATVLLNRTIQELDKKRDQLAPAFNPDENSIRQIEKGMRGEDLIEALRTHMVDLVAATMTMNATKTFLKQKVALLALSEVGELLVSTFPYEVPTEKAYSYLPRLLGRTKVTFSFRRKKELLGNVTIVADGYTAPITAGNFVDLSMRNYYTGLAVKFSRKRVGSSSAGSDFEVATFPILGYFQDEGFYDPLTAKPRRLPLEVIRVEKSSGIPSLSYSQGLSSLTDQQASQEGQAESRPLLSFDIPGLVAMNHPKDNPNGASTEFFALQQDSILDDKRVLLNGEYAPFGYIISGDHVFQNLKPNDVIDATYVDSWGVNNLVKVKQSSFSEVVMSNEAEDL